MGACKLLFISLHRKFVCRCAPHPDQWWGLSLSAHHITPRWEIAIVVRSQSDGNDHGTSWRNEHLWDNANFGYSTEKLHERVPLVLGSSDEVKAVMRHLS